MFLRRERMNEGRKEYEQGRALLRQKNYDAAERFLRQAVRVQERKLGKDHVDTLVSKHCLGCTLLEQKKYDEAERLLRLTVQGREKELGKGHVDTLASKHLLGCILLEQKKYHEAETVLRQAVQGREKELGKDDVHTLYSKHWLGLTLYDQKKYGEAEEAYQQAVQGREKVLGRDNEETLYSKFWLAVTRREQKKYREAQDLFRVVVQGEEKLLGKENIYTLDSKHGLGLTLYRQKNFQEAEDVFQQVVHGRQKVLGAEHVETLLSKYWLGCSFYNQKKYDEAEETLRQTVKGQEKELGKDNTDTLWSKHGLAVTLRDQKKYEEAEQLIQQVVQGRENMFGNEHKDTVASRRLLQELRQAFSLSNTSTSQILSGRLRDFFPAEAETESRGPYNESEIYEISLLLQDVNPRWSKVPRTYIVLRTIDCLSLLDDFIDVGFSDHWFPVTERSLPHCLRSNARVKFVSAQDLVLTKSIGLEKGEKGKHLYFKQGEPLPFERKATLGSGGFGQVDKVLSLISFKEYARKRVPRRSLTTGRGAESIKQFVAEIEVLKRLNHRHVVEFVGSYTDPKYMGLIMSPVADMDLAAYLAHADSSKYAEMRTFFGCLAKALEFLHEQNIRHKDIKPGNILVHCGNVLLTDFGLSFDFTDATGSTTISMVNGMTPRYCAPEVALQEPRNTASDVWSLGVVFTEMIVILKGRTLEYMDGFFKEHGSRQMYIRSNFAAFLEFIAVLKAMGDLSDNRAFAWVSKMVQADQQLRPTAAEVIESITSTNKEVGGRTMFCGVCCVDDDSSDSVDE